MRFQDKMRGTSFRGATGLRQPKPDAELCGRGVIPSRRGLVQGG